MIPVHTRTENAATAPTTSAHQLRFTIPTTAATTMIASNAPRLIATRLLVNKHLDGLPARYTPPELLTFEQRFGIFRDDNPGPHQRLSTNRASQRE